MRANLPDVRDPAVIEEWEPKDPLPRFENVLREAGELDDALAASILDEVEAAVEAAVTAALLDEDASPDDLLPAAFGAHRNYPTHRRSPVTGRSGSWPRSARASTSSSRPIRT